ncbi:MAG: aminodeoxychorismate synthase component I [Desulfofustis sp.]|jgi:para-aminobenzoate synthetase/4-amino-4-deoxychorismate lyase|nr:aminodeoxychorismate synthase component I [Desulfofustis sp.]
MMNGSPLSDKQIAGLLAFLSTHEHCLLLDTSKPDRLNHQSLLFVDPDEFLVCRANENRAPFLRQMENLLGQGFFLAGWFAYEFFHERRSVVSQSSPKILAEFGVYRRPLIYDHDRHTGSFPGLSELPPLEQGEYRLRDLAPNMEQAAYCRAIDAILDYIAAGDTYQVNYTCKMRFRFSGSVAGLYLDLRRSQPVPYGCFLKHGSRHLLSFSPELFFRTEPGTIITRPMKGTCVRGRTLAEDRAQAEFLQRDEKNRSENVMIVDLLRNDLARLAESLGGGRVRVASLFDVERYQTVLQMTSTVIAEYARTSGVTPAELIRALFPCGSVTGAPKIRTMEIIDELETEPRGVYTGAIGYFAPEGRAVFNVPIRTVVLDGEQGEMGIGSGIVADSTPDEEWRECLLKARFLTHPLPTFELLETMLYRPHEGYFLLAAHLERLARSAEYFSFCCDRQRILRTLHKLAEDEAWDECRRVRLTLSRHGDLQISTTACVAPQFLCWPEEKAAGITAEVAIGLAGQAVDSSNPWLFHKTTHRPAYRQGLVQAEADGLFDVLWHNERREITEGCISNVFALIDGSFVTPPLQCGLLAGVMRGWLLATVGPLPVRERIIFREDLLRAERLYLCNAVRGVLPARLIGDGGQVA